VLKVGCVNGGTFRTEENKTLPPELEPIPSLSISMGDLLISRANTRELVGGAAVAKQNYPNLLLCDKLYRLRFQDGICVSAFIALYLGTGMARGQIELSATGASSSMVNISQSTIWEMELALPEFQEQQAIVAHLEGESARFDTLTLEVQRAIALLQERRTALISAAVTGQIDVGCKTMFSMNAMKSTAPSSGVRWVSNAAKSRRRLGACPKAGDIRGVGYPMCAADYNARPAAEPVGHVMLALA
jgi:type I restriction enzyme S subunit